MKQTKSIDPKDISQAVLHQYLLSAVAPRPIAFASSVDKDGNVNLSPFSFFNVFSSNPPILIFSPALRGRDNTTKHTYENVREVPQVVINVVNFAMVEQMSLTSTEYEKGVNEFVKAGLSEIKSQKIIPPRVAESPVAFECSVNHIIPLGEGPGAGNLVLAEVEMIHINTTYLTPEGKLNTPKLDLVSRMGGSWYCRTIKPALFEIPKPLKNKGIGVDSLPKAIRESSILSANNLARLGNLEKLPDKQALEELKKEEKIALILKNTENRTIQIHQLAKKLIEQGNTQKALRLLMLENQ